MNIKKYYIGDSCLCWSIGNSISEENSKIILEVYYNIKNEIEKKNLGILDIIPAFNSLAVHFIPGFDVNELIHYVSDLFEKSKQNGIKFTLGHKTVYLPVIYNGEDLNIVAESNKLTIEEVIDIHSSKEYIVAMIGFRPHFPYLLGLDPRLETKRLNKPRLTVPEGSVAIGGVQTGVYPEKSPGGWNIIGITDSNLLQNILPGDRVIFNKTEVLNEN